jgi:hypothetical protein
VLGLLPISESDFKRRRSLRGNRPSFKSCKYGTKTSGVTGRVTAGPGTRVEGNGHFHASAGLSSEKDPSISFV